MDAEEIRSKHPLFTLERARSLAPDISEELFNTVLSVDRRLFLPDAVRLDAEMLPSDLGNHLIWNDGSNWVIKDRITLSQPKLVTQMLHLLEIKPADKVLDIGSGTGFHAACLARCASQGAVFGIERDEECALKAKLNLDLCGIRNASVIHGDGFEGIPEHGPYDAINVACAVRAIPGPLLEQLAVGGRMIIPVAIEDHKDSVFRQRLCLVRKTSEPFVMENDAVQRGLISVQEIGPVAFVDMLPHVARLLAQDPVT